MSEDVIDAEVIAEQALDQAEEARDLLPAVRAAEAMVTRAEVSVEEIVGQRDKIVAVMNAVMKEEVHYGHIPGVKKPTLLKPGAEVLAVSFRLAPFYKSERIFHDDGHLTVVSNVTLKHIPTGLVIAEGEGLCTSREKKYGKRKGERVCPECEQPQVRLGRARDGRPGNWYCWQKMGGCGATWPLTGEQAEAFEAMDVGEIDNPDLADTWNTVLKMSNKRALVAAILNGTAASDVFTQDVEDNQPSEQRQTTQTQPTQQPALPRKQRMVRKIEELLAAADTRRGVDPGTTFNEARVVTGKPLEEMAEGDIEQLGKTLGQYALLEPAVMNERGFEKFLLAEDAPF